MKSPKNPAKKSATTPALSRRQVLQVGSILGIGYHLGGGTSQSLLAKSPNERLRIGAIGLRYQGTVIANQTRFFGDIVAVCDVDRHVREQAREIGRAHV